GGREFRAAGLGREELLLVADHCALPAVERILAELPPHARGLAVIECPTPEDRLDLDRPDGVEVRWIHGAGGCPGPVLAELDAWGTQDDSTPQPDAVRGDDGDELFWEVDGEEARRVWVAAEASVARDVRRLVVGEKGLNKRAVAFMGYWRTGRAES
ncbi:siderophore-interacting protein, partial [Tessaracoccus lubricantis]